MKRAGILSFACLAAVVIFLSVWGGGAIPLSVCISATVMCGVCAAVMFARAGADDARGRVAAVPFAAWLSGVVIVLLAMSATALPGRMDGLFGHRRAEQDEQVRTAVSRAVEYGVMKPVGTGFSFTRNRAGTLRTILLAVCMFASCLLGASLTRGQKRAYAWFLILFLAVVAVAGFLHQWVFPKPKTLWWIWHVAHGRPVGCFINRTHHAGFIGLAGPLALAWLGFSVRDRRLFSAVVAAAAYAAISFGVVVSLSRGAVLAHGAGSLAILVLLVARRPTWGGAAACVMVVAAMVGCGWLITKAPPAIKEPVLERLATLREPTEIDSAQWRFGLWKDSMRIWRDYPVAGVGANAFRSVFPLYRSSTERKPFSHTENEFVGVLVEGGVIGTALLLVVLLATIIRCGTNLRNSAVPGEIGVAVAGTAVGVCVHNMVDFPLHAPVYSIVFCSMAGMLMSGADMKPAGAGWNGVSVPAKRVAAVMLGVAALIVAGLLFWGDRPYKMDDSTAIAGSAPAPLARVLVRSPTWGVAWVNFGTTVLRPERPETSRLAAFCADRASACDPNNYLLWERVGYLRMAIGDTEGANAAFKRMNKLRPWKDIPRTEFRY